MNEPNRMTERLPDLLFLRRRDIEAECGLELAGHLLTDLPKSSRPSGRDRELIKRIIKELRELLQDTPGVAEVAIWRTEGDGIRLNAPYDLVLLTGRFRGRLHIAITVFPD